jgi:glycosyltransferase involved in cell wall biosynthesis
MTGTPTLSVIVPFYNEEASIRAVHAAIVEAVEALGIPFEMVFVDDGSQDRTIDFARNLAREDARVTVIVFRRNYGQTAAMAAGIAEARGRILVTMDGDLQNDPSDIGRLVAAIDDGYDLVVGWRRERRDRVLSRKVPSVIANWLISRVTGTPIHDNGCTLKAYRSELIKALPLYVEMHRFIPAIASMAGSRIAEIEVRHHERKFGESKYGLSRTYKVLLDVTVIKLVTTFATRPMLIFSLLAASCGLASMAAFVRAFWYWAHISGDLPVSLVGTGLVFLLAAVILGLSGVLGEFIVHVSDPRELDFSPLTARAWGARLDAPAPGDTSHA